MREPVVVVDSGPLIALARIGQRALLPSICERIIVPARVWEEVTISDPDAPGAAEVRAASIIESVNGRAREISLTQPAHLSGILCVFPPAHAVLRIVADLGAGKHKVFAR